MQALAQLVDALVVVGPDAERSTPAAVPRATQGRSGLMVLAEGADLTSIVLRAELAGRCWTSVPPQATFSSCVPRQIASTGMSRSSAPRTAPARSDRGRAWYPTVIGCGSAP